MVGELIADRYELKDPVGTGGMSTVFCAHDTLLERDVALKILHEHHSRDDDYVERFRHEARAVAQLSHPNIVTVIDRGEADGRQFIVFEYVEGANLKELVNGGPLPVRRVLELGREVARALAFAHAQGIVHRDVKPQNVLLSGDGRAKVTDFGIARSLDAVGGRTETGTVLGTSHYIAPEQARGERVDTKTDVYSFGCMLFEMLTGEVPFDGDSFLTVAMRHVNEPAPSVLERRPDAPLRLAHLVERCLEKDPAERPSMDACVAELDATLAELDAKPDGEATMIARAPRELRRPARPRRRRSLRRPVLLLLVGLLVAGVVAAAFGAFGGDESGGASNATTIRLSGVGVYDPPPGDGEEHNDLVGNATDGDLDTYWTTETYRAFTKDGVGLVLDAGRDVDLATVTVRTSTPGFTAELRAGDSPTSFPDTVAGGRTVADGTTFEVGGGKERYFLLWITSLDSVARVSEVTARAS
jgi:eukaryotic-like serine/threonine-protein kinase